MRHDHYPSLNEWRKAMKAALEREKKPLFLIYRGIGGTAYVGKDSRAWCCGSYSPGVNSGAGPVKTRAHLRTANHFREWCIQNRDKAIERFPEVKPLFAEYELTFEKKPTVVGGGGGGAGGSGLAILVSNVPSTINVSAKGGTGGSGPKP